MRRLTLLVTTMAFLLGPAALAQAPKTETKAAAGAARCRYDRDGDGICDRCGRQAGQGQRRGQGCMRRGRGWQRGPAQQTPATPAK